MIEIKGKYNTAKVMIDEIDQTTRAQIESFVNQEAFANSNIAIMPDCHAGNGACIGMTMQLTDKVIPNVIGVDIGCGVTSVKFKSDEIDLGRLDRLIKQNIPSGFEINKAVCEGARPLEPKVTYVCKTIGIDAYKALLAIGSLGGGNHFIELGKDSLGFYWLTVHSGSRNFGLRVANYFQEKARQLNKDANVQEGLEYLVKGSDEYSQYLRCLNIAQKFAKSNRREILHRITTVLNVEVLATVESIHNFIDDNGIIRKGAVRADKDQMVLIPFNMRDGIALCKGKGNPDWNNSAPHGAGRVLSRTQAKKNISLEEVRGQMREAGIYTSSLNNSTVDEAPGAYKDMELIKSCIGETVEIIDMIKPIYNFKGSN